MDLTGEDALLIDTPAQQQFSRELVRFSRWLYRKGFMPGTSGNLSVRLEDGSILATPTGCSKSLLRSADMVVVDIDGHQLSGTRKVTSEIGMHLAVYRARLDVQAVIHAHPPIATGFACAGRALDEPLCAEAIMTLGPVPLAPYATTGTDELAASLMHLIPTHSAILMANHGAVTYGDNLLDAFLKMETVEHFANICLVAHQLGSARPLQQIAIDDLLQAKERYVRNAVAKMH
jgi:L-fuculose-phosphate aldolase